MAHHRRVYASAYEIEMYKSRERKEDEGQLGAVRCDECGEYMKFAGLSYYCDNPECSESDTSAL